MTENYFDKDKWFRIKQGEYRYLKKADPKNVNGYTARIGFRYFKLKDTYSKVNYFKGKLLEIDNDIRVLKEQINEIERQMLETHKELLKLC